MHGDGNKNLLGPIFLDEYYSENQTNSSNPLQLFSNGWYNRPMVPVKKRGRECEEVQDPSNPQILAKYQKRNPVSTGLRLAYHDDEPNLTASSACGSSVVLPNSDVINREIGRQNEEFDQFIKIQAEGLARGILGMYKRHTASLIAGLDKTIGKKLQEKDAEIENINSKNQELLERIKRATSESQHWQYRAKYNESIMNALKMNLQKAATQRVPDQGKEGYGDNETEGDATSSAEPKSCRKDGQMGCRACKAKEACVLLVPCRHLCLCKECDAFVSVCPVCRLVKTAGLQVYF